MIKGEEVIVNGKRAIYQDEANNFKFAIIKYIDTGLEVAVNVNEIQELPSVSCSALNSQVGGNHYKDLEIQPAEYCQKNKLGFLESNAIKYITRHRMKNKEQDIDKAIHTLQLLKEIEYGEKN